MTDFALVRQAVAALGDRREVSTGGAIVGTPAYMCPSSGTSMVRLA